MSSKQPVTWTAVIVDHEQRSCPARWISMFEQNSPEQKHHADASLPNIPIFPAFQHFTVAGTFASRVFVVLRITSDCIPWSFPPPNANCANLLYTCSTPYQSPKHRSPQYEPSYPPSKRTPASTIPDLHPCLLDYLSYIYDKWRFQIRPT